MSCEIKPGETHYSGCAQCAYARGKADGMAEARKLDYTEESMRIGGDIELAKVVAWLRAKNTELANRWADALERGEHKS